MGTSGNPARAAEQRATAQQVSDVSAFKKRNQGQTLTLPSGLTIQAKRVDLQTFVLRGTVPNPLMEIISDALQQGQKADIPAMMGVDKGELNLDMVRDMYEMVTEVVVASVIAPKVHHVPGEGEIRDDDLLFVDEIDPDDQMFIWQWACGGTSDVERFREEARADMATLAEMQGVQDPAE